MFHIEDGEVVSPMTIICENPSKGNDIIIFQTKRWEISQAGGGGGREIRSLETAAFSRFTRQAGLTLKDRPAPLGSGQSAFAESCKVLSIRRLDVKLLLLGVFFFERDFFLNIVEILFGYIYIYNNICCIYVFF